MNDFTPPPEQPLSDRARSRIRLQLADVPDDRSQERRGLLVSLVVASAVALVFGVAWYVAGSSSGQGGSDGKPAVGSPTASITSDEPTSDGPQSDGPEPPAPTAQDPTAPSSSVAPTPDYPSPTVISETTMVCGQSDDGDCASSPAGVLPGGVSLPAGTCDEEVGRHLDGAAVTAQRDYGDGSVSLYETKDAWIVCDTFASGHGGPPTLLARHQKSASYAPTLATLGISENHVGGMSEYFAAGRDFDGVRAIAYTFPDGHTEHAIVGQTGLWSMVYVPSEGILAQPGINETMLDPITVHVTFTDGDTSDLTLEWGLDTCGQTNHGC